MAHEVERDENGTWSFAYTGEAPWWGLGNGALPNDLAPSEFIKHAKADWEVGKVPGYFEIDGARFPMGREALIRLDTNAQLDVVTPDWEPVQNHEAFDFFNDWIAAGEMSMETAGVLRGGKIVFALAKTKDSFEILGKDKIDSYLLFTNPHTYGWSTSVSWSAIRVVCMNTLMASLSSSTKDKIIKVSHRNKFDADAVKETLGVSKEKLEKYKKMAVFLSSKKATGEDTLEYFKRLFPKQTNKNTEKEVSKLAKMANDMLLTQPGADIAAGTWWQPYNSVTFMLDHSVGRTLDNRVFSAWYGDARRKKMQALQLAVEFAEKV
jgi:phage/plasmid-like protein (TIGR03299 family)